MTTQTTPVAVLATSPPAPSTMHSLPAAPQSGQTSRRSRQARPLDARLVAIARGHHGVFATPDLRRLEVDEADLTGWVRSGQVLRLRRGAFVLPTAYRGRPPSEQYVQRVRAVLRSRPDAVASHHAALAVWGVDLFGVDLRCVDVLADVVHTQRRAGIVSRPRARVPTVEVDGVRTVPLALALAQVAARSGLVSGVCSIDHALAARACTRDDIELAARHLSRRSQLVVRRALARSDVQCESVGETRARLLLSDLGIPFLAQAVLTDDGGREVARVDLLLWGRVAFEFDGMVKYGGAAGREALVAEKVRESAVSGLGHEVERGLWGDLDDPTALAARLQRARRRSLDRGAIRGQAVRRPDDEAWPRRPLRPVA